jgi:putative transposase
MNTTYPSDLSDTEWKYLQQYLRESQSDCRTRRHSLRSILNAIFYVLRTGCPWRYLPSNFPPWQTVFYHFRRLRLRGRWTRLYTELYYAERQRLGRNPHASAAIMDAQSVKTVAESAHISGFDAYKRVKGRKRHLLVDTLGILLSYYVTPADMHDSQGARRLLGGLKYFVSRLKTIWADSEYRGKDLADWCKAVGGWELEVVRYVAGTKGFAVQPNRWIVERTFGWLSRYRRMSKDYERRVQTSETLIELAMIRLLLARIRQCPR